MTIEAGHSASWYSGFALAFIDHWSYNPSGGFKPHTRFVSSHVSIGDREHKLGEPIFFVTKRQKLYNFNSSIISKLHVMYKAIFDTLEDIELHFVSNHNKLPYLHNKLWMGSVHVRNFEQIVQNEPKNTLFMLYNVLL